MVKLPHGKLGEKAAMSIEVQQRYSDYQIQIYLDGFLKNRKPVVTTNPNLLEEQARKVMDPKAFKYLHGGAGEQSTMQANRLAFRQWKLIPRYLRPAQPPNLSVELFGQKYASPVIMAPVGVLSPVHPDAEPGAAKACASLSVPFTLSSASTTSIEDLSSSLSHITPPQPRWFQIYWPLPEELTQSILTRAKAHGFSMLVVSLDTFTLAWRPLDLDDAHLPFLDGIGNAVGFADPVFRRMFAEHSHDQTPESDPVGASRYLADISFLGHTSNLADLVKLRQWWDGPVILKGITSVQDAIVAADLGMDGIVVSNHGGRQVDGAVPTLEMLPEIVDAVGDRLTVLFDSGIRTGADIVKALLLGAKAVMVGRPVIYGLGIAGEKGARHVLANLLADLDQTMALTGVSSVKELNRGMLRSVNYGGDVKANL